MFAAATPTPATQWTLYRPLPWHSSARLPRTGQYFDLSAPITTHVLAGLETQWISDAGCKEKRLEKCCFRVLWFLGAAEKVP